MNRLLHDLFRLLFLLVIVGVALYYLDPTNTAVYQALLIGLFLVGGTHLTRRVLLPRLDLQSIALQAVKENNVSAAIVFAAVMYLLVAVMDLSMEVLK